MNEHLPVTRLARPALVAGPRRLRGGSRLGFGMVGCVFGTIPAAAAHGGAGRVPREWSIG